MNIYGQLQTVLPSKSCPEMMTESTKQELGTLNKYNANIFDHLFKPQIQLTIYVQKNSGNYGTTP